jgi:phosphonate degradation associated HDIG domain protein
MTDRPDIDRILATLERHGGALYGDEAVTQLQHALQCATLALDEGRPASIVVAALLHDYGHIVQMDLGAAARGIDRRHEEAGARALGEVFGPDVTEPIRLHVPAKRYLCHVEPTYYDGLSLASKRSLGVQGGPFDEAGAAAFRAQPGWETTVALRRWDDLAKDPDARTPTLAAFRPYLLAAARPDAVA